MVCFTTCLFSFFLTHSGLVFRVRSVTTTSGCVQVCVLCTAAACGSCVCGLEWISAVCPDGTDMPPVCWCLSASCWNSTRFRPPSIWADEITRLRAPTRLGELGLWSDLVVVKTGDSLNSLFVFDQNHISHSLSWIYWYSLLQLSVA